MSGYSFDYLYEAGTVQGLTLHIGVHADPNLQSVESFAAVLFFQTDHVEEVIVARVDNSEHPGAASRADEIHVQALPGKGNPNQGLRRRHRRRMGSGPLSLTARRGLRAPIPRYSRE